MLMILLFQGPIGLPEPFHLSRATHISSSLSFKIFLLLCLLFATDSTVERNLKDLFNKKFSDEYIRVRVSHISLSVFSKTYCVIKTSQWHIINFNFTYKKVEVLAN